MEAFVGLYMYANYVSSDGQSHHFQLSLCFLQMLLCFQENQCNGLIRKIRIPPLFWTHHCASYTAPEIPFEILSFLCAENLQLL
jgi:hypothetical protein